MALLIRRIGGSSPKDMHSINSNFDNINLELRKAQGSGDYAKELSDLEARILALEKGGGITPINGKNVRYVRWWNDRTSLGDWNWWCELKVFDFNSVNVAQGKAVTGNTSYDSGTLSNITDGLLTNHVSATSKGNWYIQVDLGSLVKVKSLAYKVCNTTPLIPIGINKIQVSEEGVSWITVEDTTLTPNQLDTLDGKLITL